MCDWGGTKSEPTYDTSHWTASIANLGFGYAVDCWGTEGEYSLLSSTVSGIAHSVDEYFQFDVAGTGGVDYSLDGAVSGGWLAMGPSAAQITVGFWPGPDPDGSGGGHCDGGTFEYSATKQSGG